MNRDPRAVLEVKIDLVGREPYYRSIRQGKKTVYAIPYAEYADRAAAQKPINLAITFRDIYGLPTDDQLYAARHALLDIAPPALRSLFDRVPDLRGYEQYYAWLAEVVDAVIPLAYVVETMLGESRAPCPICGATPADRSATGSPAGYTVPTGLTWHLEGHGNTNQCSVLAVLHTWARERY